VDWTDNYITLMREFERSRKFYCPQCFGEMTTVKALFGVKWRCCKCGSKFRSNHVIDGKVAAKAAKLRKLIKRK